MTVPLCILWFEVTRVSFFEKTSQHTLKEVDICDNILYRKKKRKESDYFFFLKL